MAASAVATTTESLHSALRPSTEALVSLGLYALIAVALIGILLLITRFLGHRTGGVVKGQPYESAVLPTGDSRLREPVPFYLVAIFFIVFDVEAIFVVSWAVTWDRLGWAGFAQITFFIVILFLGLLYLWKKGGLDWGSRFVHGRVRGGHQ
ncbi:NADH-quinone oxidoreductase subunit A [Geopsychrobacter electrodiphilus]|uniref:NADH-quinone oxidoreductase subunit A n=1 Tax=Geopsychrobacter electrodiphilus TaxID=225196 RepID=UPI00036BFC20|nr:NADH-quinone oxidoreductase subunit A [Geopsychrobacter electrodiphilus]